MDVQADTPRTAFETEIATESESAGVSDQVPGGRYHLVERLSTGAIGAVYKALDTILDRPVAVKCIRLDTPFADHSEDELRERFVREARIAARLQHPNIVTIHDIIATPDRGYIIMEFIEGRTLESLVNSESRLPLSTGIRILSQLASALDYAHGRNVVHRDVKPSNILVSPAMNVWVTDFGIAKSELSTNLTMAGGVLGTPDYMSPEQAKGEDVDARSDLFSLGCILFECVVGEKPFRSPSLTGVLLSIINDEPVFPLNWRSLGLPMELKPILHHALEKDREQRFGSGAELIEALENLPEEAVRKADASATGFVSDGASPDGEREPLGGVAEEGPGTPEPHEADEDAAPLRAVATDGDGTSSSSDSQADVPLEVPPLPSAEEEEPDPPDSGPAVPAEDEVPAEPQAVPPVQEDQVEASDTGEASEPPGITQEQIDVLKDESQVLHLSPTLSEDLHGVEITPEEGFLLSRIDGASRPNDILSVSPMREADTARALLTLLEKRLIKLGGLTTASAAPRPEPTKAAKERPSRAAPLPSRSTPPERDQGDVAEVERLLGLAKERDYPALLGLPTSASESERKRAYLKLVAKYHPDKFSNAGDSFREKLSSLCAAASEAVSEFEQSVEALKAKKEGERVSTLGESGANGDGLDKTRHARELYGRALTSFDRSDYWDTIQLIRQAIEADGQEAEYHGLLGRALLQNRKWRKQAADSFLKASELEPTNIDYLGFLAAIYQSEGLTTRAGSLLKRARAVEPEYELPELDGEPQITSG